MAALVFNKCCGCIELKTGCYVIAYLNLVFSLIFTFLTALGVAMGVEISKERMAFDGYEYGLTVSLESGILFVFQLLALAYSIVLLVGLHKNKLGHLKAYLVYYVILLVVLTVNLVITPLGAGNMIQRLFNISNILYCTLVIRSYYLKMCGESNYYQNITYDKDGKGQLNVEKNKCLIYDDFMFNKNLKTVEGVEVPKNELTNKF